MVKVIYTAVDHQKGGTKVSVRRCQDVPTALSYMALEYGVSSGDIARKFFGKHFVIRGCADGPLGLLH